MAGPSRFEFYTVIHTSLYTYTLHTAVSGIEWSYWISTGIQSNHNLPLYNGSENYFLKRILKCHFNIYGLNHFLLVDSFHIRAKSKVFEAKLTPTEKLNWTLNWQLVAHIFTAT